jgi:hypothetical protein
VTASIARTAQRLRTFSLLSGMFSTVSKPTIKHQEILGNRRDFCSLEEESSFSFAMFQRLVSLLQETGIDIEWNECLRTGDDFRKTPSSHRRIDLNLYSFIISGEYELLFSISFTVTMSSVFPPGKMGESLTLFIK